MVGKPGGIVEGRTTASTSEPPGELNFIGNNSPTLAESKCPYPSAGADLDSVWDRVFHMISGTYPSIAAYLTNSNLKGISDRAVEIEVNGNGFNVNMIRRKKNMAILKKVFSDFLGREIDVIIHAKVVSDENGREKKQQENLLKQEALSRSLVAETLEIFNGKVIDVKILQEEGS